MGVASAYLTHAIAFQFCLQIQQKTCSLEASIFGMGLPWFCNPRHSRKYYWGNTLYTRLLEIFCNWFCASLNQIKSNFQTTKFAYNYKTSLIPHLSPFYSQARLFECLQKTKLIEDQHTCNYTCCGRTDKGVSALGQVVSLHLRSNLLDGEGVVVPVDSRANERKGILNFIFCYCK